ncbi:MAG: FtsB family cell division protein [Alphaproteobacteria bacterium]
MWIMIKVVDILALTKKNVPVLIGACLALYFSYHIFFGRCNYSMLVALRPVVEEKADILDSLRTQTSALEEKVTLMRPATMSVDLLEERVRYVLGYSKHDEIVIFSH